MLPFVSEMKELILLLRVDRVLLGVKGWGVVCVGDLRVKGGGCFSVKGGGCMLI